MIEGSPQIPPPPEGQPNVRVSPEGHVSALMEAKPLASKPLARKPSVSEPTSLNSSQLPASDCQLVSVISAPPPTSITFIASGNRLCKVATHRLHMQGEGWITIEVATICVSQLAGSHESALGPAAVPHAAPRTLGLAWTYICCSCTSMHLCISSRGLSPPLVVRVALGRLSRAPLLDRPPVWPRHVHHRCERRRTLTPPPALFASLGAP